MRYVLFLVCLIFCNVVYAQDPRKATCEIFGRNHERLGLGVVVDETKTGYIVLHASKETLARRNLYTDGVRLEFPTKDTLYSENMYDLSTYEVGRFGERVEEMSGVIMIVVPKKDFTKGKPDIVPTPPTDFYSKVIRRSDKARLITTRGKRFLNAQFALVPSRNITAKCDHATFSQPLFLKYDDKYYLIGLRTPNIQKPTYSEFIDIQYMYSECTIHGTPK